MRDNQNDEILSQTDKERYQDILGQTRSLISTRGHRRSTHDPFRLTQRPRSPAQGSPGRTQYLPRPTWRLLKANKALSLSTKGL